MEFTPGLVAVLAALTVFLGLYAIFAPVVSHKRDTTGEEFIETRKETNEGSEDKGNSTVKYVRRMLNNFLPALGMKSLSPKTVTSFKNLMIKSGNPWKLQSPEEFIAAMVLFGIVGGFIGLIFSVLGLIPVSPFIMVPAVGGLAGIFPYSVYNTAKNKRVNEIQKQLPEGLDLLVVTLTSGLPFAPSLTEVVPQMPEGLLKDIFAGMDERLRGGDSLENVLNAFSREIDSEEVESFVKAILQSQQLGSDITETLASQAIFVRTNHEARVQRKIAKLSTTMFIPLAGTMLPAFLVIFIAPNIMSILTMI